MGMAGSLTHDVIQGPPPPPAEGGWGGDSGGSDGRGAFRRASFTGLYVLLAASTMLFAAFTSAMVVRRGLSDDWVSMPKPPILLVNTVILLASSVALEVARRALKHGGRARFNGWWTAGTGLGILFLCGQALAWNQLNSASVFISTNPSSSFFYVFTVLHALHVIGGLLGLAYVISKLRRGVLSAGTLIAASEYWHFMGLLWIYLLIVLRAKI